jgi:hypothetical protein
MMLRICIRLLSFICMHTSLEVFNFFFLKIFFKLKKFYCTLMLLMYVHILSSMCTHISLGGFFFFFFLNYLRGFKVREPLASQFFLLSHPNAYSLLPSLASRAVV